MKLVKNEVAPPFRHGRENARKPPPENPDVCARLAEAVYTAKGIAELSGVASVSSRSPRARLPARRRPKAEAGEPPG